jgi:hypothetical protein
LKAKMLQVSSGRSVGCVDAETAYFDSSLAVLVLIMSGSPIKYDSREI